MNTNFIAFKIFIFATCLLMTTFAIAQPHPEKMVERIAEDLNLSEEQKSEILKIHEQAASQCQNAESKKDHHKCMRKQKDSIDSATKDVLTTEQQTKFDEIKANHPRHNRNKSRN